MQKGITTALTLALIATPALGETETNPARILWLLGLGLLRAE